VVGVGHDFGKEVQRQRERGEKKGAVFGVLL